MAKKHSVAACRNIVGQSKQLTNNLKTIVKAASEQLNKTKAAIDAIRRERIFITLGKYEIERLNYNNDSFSVKTLREAGYPTILSVFLATEQDIAKIKGISEEGAKRIKAVALKIAGMVSERTDVTLSYERHTAKETQLLKLLYFLLHGSKTLKRSTTIYNKVYIAVQKNIDAAEILCNGWSRLLLLRKNRIIAESSVDKLEVWLSGSTAAEIPTLYNEYLKLCKEYEDAFYWEDYRKYSIQYDTLIENIDKDHKRVVVGEFGLDAGLQKEIEGVELELDGLKTELRSYQRFGVQYIIHQKNVLLGDEMGLGKTIQAISSLLHLKNTGATHFMVVCPACVLVNWYREITTMSDLEAIIVHGRDVEALKKWESQGGVAITTYETLNGFDLAENALIAMLVVDEAHYVINPQAKRTQNVGKLREKSQRILYLTGTPLVNRVEEMCFLIECLQPELAKVLKENGFADPETFRQILMPVYLRRTREMVLTQLPELTESNIWCDMSEPERIAYKAALAKENNMMELRRVSWSSPNLDTASKALALKEICSRAEREGRKVLVFSYFLNTLEAVKTVLGEKCIGVMDGSMPSQARDELIKAFDAAPNGAVMAGQIKAMGVGLNIQSASIVVLCEPQFTPADEDQAISRSYRMGQVNSVHAYRLVCVDTFDERVLLLLDQKQKQFDSYADRSVAGAISVTDQDISAIITKEKERWGLE